MLTDGSPRNFDGERIQAHQAPQPPQSKQLHPAAQKPEEPVTPRKSRRMSTRAVPMSEEKPKQRASWRDTFQGRPQVDSATLTGQQWTLLCDGQEEFEMVPETLPHRSDEPGEMANEFG